MAGWLLIAMLACAPVGSAWAEAVLSVDGDAAVDEDAGFGLDAFHKAKRGSAKPLPDGEEIGYRYITGDAGSVVLIAARDVAVVYVPAPTAERLDIDLADDAQRQALLSLFEAADEANSDGGAILADLGLAVEFTSETVHRAGGRIFRFAMESQGRTYAGVETPEGADGEAADSGAANPLFCDYAELKPASEMSIVADRTFTEEVALFFGRLDWSPLLVSARTVFVATLIVVVLGVLAAWLTLHVGPRVKSVLDWLFTLPMILPPTMCGFLLLFAFGKNSPTGRWLIEAGLNLPFTWPAAVIAAVVVSFPFMYRAARGAFEGMDPDLMDAARTLGWSEGRVLVRLMVPMTSASLVAGVVLAFTRALGEFGATLFFAGSYAGTTQTIPLAIYYDWMGGDEASAWLWAIVVIAFSAVAMYALNRISASQGPHR